MTNSCECSDPGKYKWEPHQWNLEHHPDCPTLKPKEKAKMGFGTFEYFVHNAAPLAWPSCPFDPQRMATRFHGVPGLCPYCAVRVVAGQPHP